MISNNSPTQGLVGQLADGFKKANHSTPLLSLENSYNAEDLRDRAIRIAKIAGKKGKLKREYHIEAKFDGLSVEFIYEKGEFSQAITRGDGKIGEDITANAKMITSLPKTISEQGKISVRGEIMMPKSQLLRLNEQREKAGLSPFSNTRNAAAWSIKLLDSWEVAKRGLIVVVYDQLWGKTIDLKANGFPLFELTKPFEKTWDIEQIIERCQDAKLKQFLDEQDFECDGLVIKISDEEQEKQLQKSDFSLFSQQESKETPQFSVRELLWTTEHHPRRAIAYKFPAQQVASQILSVDFQVGRSGIITPVANIAPVALSGATISRVSLHNFDFIASKQIKNGDFVRVQRSGEVIPYIIWTIKERRNGNEEPIVPPLFCPSCGNPITNIDIHYYCTNPACPAQIKEKIVHFVSRDAMDIAGIGEAMIEVLVQQKMLTSVADLYQLTKPENLFIIRRFPNFGEKKIAELTLQLESSKQQPLWRLLNALGIPNVWKKTAQDLADYLAEKKVHSLEEMIKTFTETALDDIYGIGEKIIQGIQFFVTHPETLELLNRLENYGLSFNTMKDEEKKANIKNGKNFSLTGSFPLSRLKLIEQIEAKGYHYEEHPSSSTQLMLIWEKPWSKAEKAKKLWIPILEGRETIKEKFELTEVPIDWKQKNQSFQSGLF